MEAKLVDINSIPPAVRRWARRAAEDSEHRFRLGAVIYRRSRPIVSGYNEGRFHPRSPHSFGAIDAEFAAVLHFSKWHAEGELDCSRYSIYVHRIKRDGSVGLAKPCEHCMKMLLHLGFKSIAYSVSDREAEILS